MPNSFERRSFGPTESRADAAVAIRELRGYAALFNVQSANLGGPFELYESIAPGAFDAVLANDVRHLKNHDPNWVLGRTIPGTLRLSVDDRGLHTITDPPETQWADDLLVSIRRRDISQMSFAFVVGEDSWRYDREKDVVYRTILKLSALYDVSTVTYPAYPDTSIVVAERTLQRAAEVRAESGVCARSTRRVNLANRLRLAV